MATDPFDTVRQEISESVGALRRQREQWRELLETAPTSDEFKKAGEELLQGVRDTQADLEDLADTIVVVEQNRERFQIGDDELKERRGFVDGMRRELSAMENEIVSPETRHKAEANARAVCFLSYHTNRFLLFISFFICIVDVKEEQDFKICKVGRGY